MGTGGREHGLLIRAVLSGVVGVLFGMLSYFAAAQIMLGLLEGRPGDTFYLGWCASAHLSFLLRATLYSLVVSQPHKATFTILKRMLQKAMEVLTREKTVPMIVRQLKTVCNADQILVLDRRKIVQGGTHDTLVTQRGIYRNFVIERNGQGTGPTNETMHAFLRASFFMYSLFQGSCSLPLFGITAS